MKIILDERETALYEKCVSAISYTLEKDPPEILKRVLPLGDMLITTDDSKELVIVERKSLQDLLSSIKDGRYEEQSYRLIHSSGHIVHHIIYVVEGIMNQLKSWKEKKMVYSAMTSLNSFKGFSVIRTSSIQETAEWLVLTADKMGRELSKGKQIWSPPYVETNAIEDNTTSAVAYCNVVKKVKKDNITPENWGEIVLCQIPGISSVSAIAIMKRFQSISQLLQELKENPNCLADIVCDSDNKKPRKLNKTVIEGIKRFLLYNNTENSIITAS
jgi:crossover junction endonuclease MUS81